MKEDRGKRKKWGKRGGEKEVEESWGREISGGSEGKGISWLGKGEKKSGGREWKKRKFEKNMERGRIGGGYGGREGGEKIGVDVKWINQDSFCHCQVRTKLNFKSSILIF